MLEQKRKVTQLPKLQVLVTYCIISARRAIFLIVVSGALKSKMRHGDDKLLSVKNEANEKNDKKGKKERERKHDQYNATT